MRDVFKNDREFNQWDKLVLDVKEVYKKHPLSVNVLEGAQLPPHTALFRRFYKTPLVPLSLRRFIHKLSLRTSLDTSWFEDFSNYWSSVLGGRPLLGVQDFYFLKNLYRIRFQDNQIPDTNDVNIHLEAWQRPELLYQLLHLIYKETIVDYANLIKKMFEYKPKLRNILEFGCGTAPVTASLYEFFEVRKEIKVYFSDIQTIAFHYAAYRFARYQNANPVILKPENEFKLANLPPLDVITCITVFEHLNKPLDTVKDFHALLLPGGLFFFDYIKSDGSGMDTNHGSQERLAVLKFVASHFDILEGDLNENDSTGLVIARKK
ncbi:MAG TPA: class I SAM-dependent methyltransferase [Anaerolineales bacterium]|nr:class I SAM-dependent methyltransferase [Anaerolineales bacterium]